MDDRTKQRVLDEAQENVERLAHVSARQPAAGDSNESPDPIAKWRKGVEAQEREFASARAKRQADADAGRDAAVAWQNWVGREIADAVKGIGKGLGEVLSDKLVQISRAFDERDERISKLECELLRLQVELAKLDVRFIQSQVERDRESGKVLDLPLVKRQERIN
jgi:hypothetical protein